MIKAGPERLCKGEITCKNYIPLEEIKDRIEKQARLEAFPIVVVMEQIKIGSGLASNFVKAEPCIHVYHCNHKNDWNSFAIVEVRGISTNSFYLKKYLVGNSKNHEPLPYGRRGIIGDIMAAKAQEKCEEERRFIKSANEMLIRAICQ